MTHGLFKLAAQIHKNKESWNPCSAALRATTPMILGSNWLIQGPNNVGLTATALEFLYEFNRQGHDVYYFDIGNSLFAHRITDLDNSRLVIIRPQGPEEFASVLYALAKEVTNPILIFDSLHLFREEDIWKLQGNLDKFLDLCHELFNHPTVVVTERTMKPGSRPRWKNLLKIRRLAGWKSGTEVIGHTVELEGSLGTIKGYIDYNAGRFSKRFFEATKLVEAGKNPSTIFEFDGKEVRGLINFVRQTDPLAEAQQ